VAVGAGAARRWLFFSGGGGKGSSGVWSEGLCFGEERRELEVEDGCGLIGCSRVCKLVGKECVYEEEGRCELAVPESPIQHCNATPMRPAQVGNGEAAPAITVPMTLAQGLRYGENPHQVSSLLCAVCCAVLCCAVLCCAVLCCAVLCCAVLSGSSGGLPHTTSKAVLTPKSQPPNPTNPKPHNITPPQSAAFYVDDSLAEFNAGGVATSVQHNGKEMSYNNYLDADAAYVACCDFKVWLSGGLGGWGGVGWVGWVNWGSWGGAC